MHMHTNAGPDMACKVSLLGPGCTRVGIFPATLHTISESVGPVFVRRDRNAKISYQVVIELYR